MDDHMIPWVAGNLPKGTRSVTFRVEADKWSGDWTVPIALVPTASEAIEAVQSPALDAIVRSALRVGVRADANPQTNTDHMLGARLDRALSPLPDDVAIGVVVEFFCDGVPVKSWSLRLYGSIYGGSVDWVRIQSLGWNANDPADLARWTVEVRGDAAAALTDVKRDRYWSGRFTVPLSDILVKE
jgi:hypothetical protein